MSAPPSSRRSATSFPISTTGSKLCLTRDREAITYETRFLAWWGLFLFMLQLGSRRQLDFAFDRYSAAARITSIASPTPRTKRCPSTTPSITSSNTSRGTLPWRLADGASPDAHEGPRRRPPARRLRGAVSTAPACSPFANATAIPVWSENTRTARCTCTKSWRPSCSGQAGVVISLGSEFIENADADIQVATWSASSKTVNSRHSRDWPHASKSIPAIAHRHRWRCLVRLRHRLSDHPGQRLVLRDDLQGRTPAERVGRIPATPIPLSRQRARAALPDGTRHVFRWVRTVVRGRPKAELGRSMPCNATKLADRRRAVLRLANRLSVTATNVDVIATKGGRRRWKIENEGFNRQKNTA